ncbi:hypothetical protein ACJ73_00118 [Blastomyces percursus]|uniref:non-specific serine/threonine protein kinase n=1 Tax=Blastomyces percursus TaxID=1658174 RepID=A0A1J9RIY3_9EURO|nr:hypothetical protein ACJ73_00118 [Blastomyces percursus]
MASLSEDDRDIIKRHPFRKSLDHLRKSLQDVERSFSVASSLDGANDSSEHDCQKAISRLLLGLADTEAGLVLRSRFSSRDVASELALLFGRVRKGDLSYTYYRPLVKLIIQKASDFDIWSAVLDLITKLLRVTPPASGEQTRRLVETRVFEEIRGCTYRDVEGFFEKYFERKTWTDRAHGIYELIKDQHVDGKWSALPDSPTQNEVQDWLFRLQDDLLSKERRHYYTIKVPNELTGAEAQRQIDLIIKQKTGEPEPSDTKHNWKDIEVIGELKASNNGVKRTLVQIGRYVRDVFTCQPTRRYIHAFTICGREMEVWVFDRSGCYSPGAFDIHNEPERFIQVITGYTMMNQDELGLDTFTEQDGDCHFIHVEQEGAETMKRLQLKLDPLTPSAGSCLPRNVLLSYKGSGLRTGTTSPNFLGRLTGASLKLIFSDWPIRKESKASPGWSVIAPSPASKRCAQTLHLRNPTLSVVLSSRLPSIFSRSFSELHGLTIAESTGERPSRKRKSTDVGTKSSKRSRSNSQRSSPPRNEVIYDVEEAQGTSLLATSNSPYDNHVLRCLVIFPAGRPIHKYEAPLELLEALRDAVKAHRSLYFKGNMLHRDISENNIIITDAKKTGFVGMLIDMDLAKELGSGRSGARCRTGTMEFMAIEVLLNVDHTYRHDLESNPKGQPTPSLLTKWYTGNYEKIANAKRGNVDANGFERILAKEFPPEFNCIKSLCNKLRSILFPIRDDAIFTGTPKDPEILYGPIIKAFDMAIDEDAPTAFIAENPAILINAGRSKLSTHEGSAGPLGQRMPQLENSHLLHTEADVLRASNLYLLHPVNVVANRLLAAGSLLCRGEVTSNGGCRTDVRWVYCNGSQMTTIAILEVKNTKVLHVADFTPAIATVNNARARRDDAQGQQHHTHFERNACWLSKQAKSTTGIRLPRMLPSLIGEQCLSLTLVG